METKIPDHLLVKYTEVNQDYIFLNNIEVDFNFRGKGIFKNFLNELSKEFKVIELESFPTLIPMYKHLGFTDIGVIDDEDYHLMRKESLYITSDINRI